MAHIPYELPLSCISLSPSASELSRVIASTILLLAKVRFPRIEDCHWNKVIDLRIFGKIEKSRLPALPACMLFVLAAVLD